MIKKVKKKVMELAIEHKTDVTWSYNTGTDTFHFYINELTLVDSVPLGILLYN